MYLLCRTDGKPRQGGGGRRVPPTDSAGLEMPCLHYLGKKALETGLSTPGVKGQEGLIVPKEEAHQHLRVFTPLLKS